MSCLKFIPIKIESKDFHKQKQVTDIFTVDKNKAIVSERVSCNNKKSRWDTDCTTLYQNTKEHI